MKKIVCFLTLLIFAFMISGCASIVSNSQYPVTINSHPSGAEIQIVDETGKVFLKAETPTTVTLAAGNGYFKGKDYTITFIKEGYSSHSASIERGVDGWYLAGNLLFGGLIGWFIVDPATGAMWKLPKEITADLSPQQASLNDEINSIHVLSIDQVPEALRDKMVQIN